MPARSLMGYRYLETDQKTITQFTISGLPTGARARLAVMDAYDGIVLLGDRRLGRLLPSWCRDRAASGVH